MSVDAIKAARAYVETVWDGSAVMQGMASMATRMSQLGQPMGNPLGGVSDGLAEILPVLDGSSKSLRMIGDSVQSLGLDWKALETSMRSQAGFISDVTFGSQEAADTLKFLGVSLKQLDGLTDDEQFIVLANAISKVDDEFDKVAAATEIFGDQAEQLMPLLELGADGMSKASAQARVLSKTSTDAARANEKIASSAKPAASSLRTLGDRFAKATQQAEQFGRTGSSIAMSFKSMLAPLLGGGVFGYAITAIADGAASIQDMSDRTSLGVETIGELSYAAKLLATDMESLEGGLVKQTKFLGEARAGSASAAKSLAAMGLAIEDFNGLSGDQAFALFADAIAAIPDEVDQANAAMDIFGKSGTGLLPMLKAGSSGIEELRAKARELGVVMSEDSVSSLDQFADLWDELKMQLGGVATQIATALVPAISSAIQYVQPLLSSGIAWLSQNGELIASIVGVTGALGAGFATFGTISSVVAMGMGAIVTVGGALFGVLGALMSPIGIVSAGLIGLAAYSIDFKSIWESMAGTLGESLSTAAELIKNGELSLAFEIVWASIQLVFSQGVRSVVEQTRELVTTMLELMARAMEQVETWRAKISTMIAKVGAAAGETVGLLPEGTLAEIDNVKNTWLFSPENLRAVADGYGEIGSGVSELEAKLQALKDKANTVNIAADEARGLEEAKRKQGQQAGADRQAALRDRAAEMQGGLMDTNSPLAGTFSAVASRQLFSQDTSKQMVGLLEGILDNTGKTADAAGGLLLA